MLRGSVVRWAMVVFPLILWLVFFRVSRSISNRLPFSRRPFLFDTGLYFSTSNKQRSYYAAAGLMCSTADSIYKPWPCHTAVLQRGLRTATAGKKRLCWPCWLGAFFCGGCGAGCLT
jgi:hypothetical protein